MELDLVDKQLFTDIKVLYFQFQLSSGEQISFGLNAYKVREVVVFEKLSPLTSDYLPFVGMLDYRGVPVPVIDLTEISPGSLAKPTYARIIIIETMGKLTGLLVDQRIKSMEFENKDLKPLELLPRNEKINYVTGYIRLIEERSYIHLLDIESILAPHLADSTNSFVPTLIGKGRRVLIVEDSSLFQKKVAKHLSELGFATDIANDGALGLQKIDQERYDLIFSDIEMPHINGIEMVRKMRHGQSVNRETPVIFHSSLSTPSLLTLIEEEKLGSYITKFDPQLIQESIAKALK